MPWPWLRQKPNADAALARRPHLKNRPAKLLLGNTCHLCALEQMTMNIFQHLPRTAAMALALGMAGCANFMPPTQVEAQVAPQWQAPLPHQGTVSNLAQWWQSLVMAFRELPSDNSVLKSNPLAIRPFRDTFR